MESMDAYLKLADYVDNIAQDSPDYGIIVFFNIKGCTEKKCKEFIDRTDEINKLMPNVSKSEKGKLSYEKGPLLEKMAKEILGIRNIFKIDERVECDSNEIDLLMQSSTNNAIYQRLLPAYLKNSILIECKNHSQKIDVTLLGKFYSLLRYKRVKFGIIFSYHPLTGENEWDAAIGLSKKLYLRDETMIINITVDDIKDILLNKDNKNLITLIKKKVEHIKFHTDINRSIAPHPAQLKMKKTNK